jgi:hypothetical protein
MSSATRRGLVALAIAGGLASPLMAGEPGGILGRLFRRTESSAAKRVDPASRRAPRPVAEAEKSAPDRTLADFAPPEEVAPAPAPGTIVGPPANADPLLSRFAIGRASDGQTFGLFMHIFADGTVMDSNGLHHSDPAAFERLKDTLRETPLEQLERHTEGTASDYLEVVYLVAYQRAGTKLRAVPLSHAGNTSTAPPSLQRLHAALEAFQAHISSPVPGTPAAAMSAPVGTGSVVPATDSPYPAVVDTPYGPGPNLGSAPASPYGVNPSPYGPAPSPAGSIPAMPSLPQVNPAPPPPAVPVP